MPDHRRGAEAIVVDLNLQRLDFCRRQMHVEYVLQPSVQLEAQLREIAGGNLPEVVIDATGNPQSMSSAFGLIAHGGRLVFVGLTGEEVRFRHAAFHRPEGTLLCSRNALPADFARIIDLIEAGRIDTRPWITHRCKLEDLPEAMPGYLRPESGVVKATVAVE